MLYKRTENEVTPFLTWNMPKRSSFIITIGPVFAIFSSQSVVLEEFGRGPMIAEGTG